MLTKFSSFLFASPTAVAHSSAAAADIFIQAIMVSSPFLLEDPIARKGAIVI
jgi:hypothetical protein